MAIRRVFLAVLLPYCIIAFPTGPPVNRTVCTSMSPSGHPSNTATGPAPYIIVVSNDTYTAGQPIQVTVRANPGVTFAGFFVQARNQSDSALGTFSNVPQGSQVLACTSAAGAWSHNNKNAKTEITATWMPPSDDLGSIAFQATIVKGPESVYWEGVRSQPLSYVYSATPSLAPGVESTPSSKSAVSSSIFLLTFAVFWAMVA
ncbi:putative defense protein isoform X2 [Patiria miniata]|uniref:Reelin domain-containing protein n=1 Tax=Patiria miniata TaxID=46514 RepID=A0A914ATR2_PATMI|nr:putative defense protein isoform X2 [Patiria miniata]